MTCITCTQVKVAVVWFFYVRFQECKGSAEFGLDNFCLIWFSIVGLSLENEQRIEKLSLRKQLKLKCQGKNLSSFPDKALVRVGIGTDMYQPLTLPVYGQACKYLIIHI